MYFDMGKAFSTPHPITKYLDNRQLQKRPSGMAYSKP